MKMFRFKNYRVIPILVLAAASLSSCNFTGASGQYGVCGGVVAQDNKSVMLIVRGEYDTANYADNSQRTYDAKNAIWNTLDNTDLDLYTPNGAGQLGDADVWIDDGDYGNWCGIHWADQYGEKGRIGQASCPDKKYINSKNRCMIHNVFIQRPWLDDTDTPVNFRTSLMLHETLHTVGLTHTTRTGDIMNPEINGATSISTIDRDLINGFY